jgi:hypothetical protein
MDYKLNPDAKEFVPVHSPTRETFPTSTTSLSPDAPNFEPLAEITPNPPSSDLFSVPSFEPEAQRMEFPDEMNPFGLNSVPIPVVDSLQMASPSFSMAETPSYAVLENIGVQDTPLATPQMPENALWTGGEQLQDPMDFIEEQFKAEPVLDAAPVSALADEFALMSSASKVEKVVPQETPDFSMEPPTSLEKQSFGVSPVLDDLGKINFPLQPYVDQLVTASSLSEDCTSPPLVEQQQISSPVFEEQLIAETQQPDLLECLPQQITPVLDDIKPVEKMIEDEPVVSPRPPVTAPAAQPEHEPIVEEVKEPVVSDKIKTPEEPKVEQKLTKLYRHKTIKGRHIELRTFLSH